MTNRQAIEWEVRRVKPLRPVTDDQDHPWLALVMALVIVAMLALR